MARSRLARVGTIHSRTTGLLRAGAMKEEDKPLWFDIYEAFPPKDEPRFDRPESSLPIRQLFYEEDVIRAKYHKDHKSLPFVRLNDISHMTQTQKFIAAYQQLKKDGVTETELYQTAVSQAAPVGAKSEESDKAEAKPNTSTATKDGGTTDSINIDITQIFKGS